MVISRSINATRTTRSDTIRSPWALTGRMTTALCCRYPGSIRPGNVSSSPFSTDPQREYTLWRERERESIGWLLLLQLGNLSARGWFINARAQLFISQRNYGNRQHPLSSPEPPPSPPPPRLRHVWSIHVQLTRVNCKYISRILITSQQFLHVL